MLHHIEAQVLVLLLIASIVGMAARRLRVPYTLALVVAGLLLGFVHIEALSGLSLGADLLLLLLLPPLLFEAALHIDMRDFRRDLGPILVLAVPGVLVGAALTAGLSWLALGATGLSPAFDWPQALLFAAVIGATDPISVLAIFKELGITRRLYLLVEGESLLNDGVAVVLFLILGAVLGTSEAHVAPEGTAAILAYGIKTFVWMAGAGLGIGAVVGAAASVAARQIDDHLIETTLTTLVAWGSFLLAEQIEASGVLATVSAGMMVGFGKSYGMSAHTRVAVEDFWEYMAFLANSFVFLLVGLELDPLLLTRKAPAIAAASLAVLISRAVVVHGSAPIVRRLADPIPTSWRHVMVWGGLRGSLSMVLVLTLPQDFPGRATLVALVFGVVASSLFLQGLSVGPLLRHLGLSGGDADERRAWERARGRSLAARHALHLLDELGEAQLYTAQVRSRLEHWYAERRALADAEAEAHAGAQRSDEQLVEGMLRLLAAEREAVREAERAELISGDVVAELLAELSARQEHLQHLAHSEEEERSAGLEALLSEGDDQPRNSPK